MAYGYIPPLRGVPIPRSPWGVLFYDLVNWGSVVLVFGIPLVLAHGDDMYDGYRWLMDDAHMYVNIAVVCFCVLISVPCITRRFGGIIWSILLWTVAMTIFAGPLIVWIVLFIINNDFI